MTTPNQAARNAPPQRADRLIADDQHVPGEPLVDGPVLYQNTSWQQVPVTRFDGGLAVPARSWIDYWCDYANPESRDVYQGTRSTDEMCMLIGSYYPADPALANGYELQVAAFIESDEKIEIDTRTGEFKKRATN